ncbi:hypothetical protein QJS04_geneDACA005524 [Acorus gramineus]|uniref:Uncharacterized protein n=1 Tax=Acorus gramineus TaxID=55184 RepID=A0AAV9A4H1_ACOGR|nr:hypothetical protein QJS04_geneDACA005524 [Acorus gramineus]
MADDEVPLSKRLYWTRHTVFEMLTDRGGYVIADSDLNETYQQFLDRFTGGVTRVQLHLVFSRRDDPSDGIYIFFVEEEFRKTIMEAYLRKVDREKATRVLFVVPDTSRLVSAQSINEQYPDWHVEIFLEKELLVNITKNEMVPQYELLNEDMKEALLEFYKAKETQLPRILLHDPIARYYGISRGDVMKITRQSQTAGTYVTYRIAV